MVSGEEALAGEGEHSQSGEGWADIPWPFLFSHLSPCSFGRLSDPEDRGIGVCCGPLLCWNPAHPE